MIQGTEKLYNFITVIFTVCILWILYTTQKYTTLFLKNVKKEDENRTLEAIKLYNFIPLLHQRRTKGDRICPFLLRCEDREFKEAE